VCPPAPAEGETAASQQRFRPFDGRETWRERLTRERLVSLIRRAESDEAIQVLVFRSTDPDYFISHVDITQIEEAAKLTGEASIALLFRHLSGSRLVTIAQIAGRVRGAGSEFVLACDMRFAARESALFSQPGASVRPDTLAGMVPSISRASWAVRVHSKSC
jgi:enoyl-CoA hydratase/carnithine racemase